MSPNLVPVYRMHQCSLVSPCVLGDLCRTCARHQPCHQGRLCGSCRRFVEYECERQAAARPAFMVTIRQAFWLVYAELATFVHRGTAIRLAFDRIGNLRDMSCVIDPDVIFGYTCGTPRARVAVNRGWDTESSVIMVSESQAQVLAQTVFHYL